MTSNDTTDSPGTPAQVDVRTDDERDSGSGEADIRADSADEETAAGTAASRSPRRRVVLLTGAIVAAALAGGLVAAFAFGGRAGSPAPTAAPETEAVTVGDLTETVKASGKIALTDQRTIGSDLPGTITSLPEPGATIARGSELYRVDAQPVVLMLGAVPVFRDFEPGMTDGPDVQQLQQNLAALGYYGGEADGSFGSATEDAILDWQDAVGLEEDGVIERGRVVMLPGEPQVVDRPGAIGSPNSQSVLTVAQNQRDVTLNLPADRRDVTAVGAPVSIKLPGGTEIAGTVSAFHDPKEQDENGSKKLMVPITVAFEDQAAAAGMQDLDVSATFERVAASDAMIVPVESIIAGLDGGSVVQRLGADGTIEDVPVEVGEVANGLCAVTSDALAEGDQVVVGK